MVEEITWSPIALETYNGIIEYLLGKFGEAAVKKFIRRVDDKLQLIKSRPTMFRPTQQIPDTYITNIQKKTTLTYRYKPHEKRVELIVFWGMQNPANKPI